MHRALCHSGPSTYAPGRLQVEGLQLTEAHDTFRQAKARSFAPFAGCELPLVVAQNSRSRSGTGCVARSVFAGETYHALRSTALVSLATLGMTQ